MQSNSGWICDSCLSHSICIEAEDSSFLGLVQIVGKSAHRVALMGDSNVSGVDRVYEFANPGSLGARILDLVKELGLLQ